MSGYQPQYQTGAPVSGPGQDRSRPGALTAALAASGLAALLVMISQFLSLATGKDVLWDELAKELGASSVDELKASPLGQAAVDDAYGKLQTRAILGIVFAVLVLLFVLLSRRGGLGSRITLALVVLIMGGLTIISVKDPFPAFGKVGGTAAIILAPIAAILLFLPAVNAYAKRQKAAKAG